MNVKHFVKDDMQVQRKPPALSLLVVLLKMKVLSDMN